MLKRWPAPLRPSANMIQQCCRPRHLLLSLLAGTGSQLLVHALPSGQLLHAETVLPNAGRVHGVASAPLQGGLLAIAVHGDHYANASCTASNR